MLIDSANEKPAKQTDAWGRNVDVADEAVERNKNEELDEVEKDKSEEPDGVGRDKNGPDETDGDKNGPATVEKDNNLDPDGITRDEDEEWYLLEAADIPLLEESMEVPRNKVITSRNFLDHILVVKHIPYKRWCFAFMNRFWLKFRGGVFLAKIMKTFDSAVYRLQLRNEVTMVCDHLGLRAFLDPRKVTVKAIGYAYFNSSFAKKEDSPSNSKVEMEMKSKMVATYVNHIASNLDVSDLVETVCEELRGIGNVEHPTRRKAERFDFEGVIVKTVSNVLTHVMLGSTSDDGTLLQLQKLQKLTAGVNIVPCYFSKINDAFANERLQKHIEMAVRRVEGKIGYDISNYYEILTKLVYTLVFDGYLGIKASVISGLICFLRLTEPDQQLLRKEADQLLVSDNQTATLHTLPFVSAFYREVLRLHPPSQLLHAVAKEEFILESTSGNFIIQKNEVLCGYPHMAHRDPTLFKEPDSFSIHRSQEEMVKYNCLLEGFPLNELAVGKQIYIGRRIFSAIVKTFILAFTKCSLTPTEVPIYTGRSVARVEASDKPLRVLNFSFETNCS